MPPTTKRNSLTFEVVDCRYIGRHQQCHHWIEVAYIQQELRTHLRGLIEHQKEMAQFSNSTIFKKRQNFG